MSKDEIRPEVELPAEVEPPTEDDTRAVKDLLAEGVPLALLVDLVTPESTSKEILEAEGLPEVAWWEPDGGSAPADAAPDPEP